MGERSTDPAAGDSRISGSDRLPKLYSELAPWWPLMSAPTDYEEEAAFYRRRLVEACARVPRTLLELGSGGGNNASHLKANFDRLVLVDRSPGMLEVSRALNLECEHVEIDLLPDSRGRGATGDRHRLPALQAWRLRALLPRSRA